jgi:PKD repeat protein
VKKIATGSIRITIFKIFLVGIIVFVSCKKDYPSPEISFDYSVAGNTVYFTADIKNAGTFIWDFGDGAITENDTNPVHTYNIYDKDYSVDLTAEGHGKKIHFSKTITIPPMTSIEKLSGDKSFPLGKKWRLNASAGITVAKADASLTTAETLSASTLTSSGLNSLYNIFFIFKSNGDFIIAPEEEEITAGLNYCTFRHIINRSPSLMAENHNLTLVADYLPAQVLSYGFTELKDLTLEVTDDGISSREVTYCDVQTISISYGGFLGILDFCREYVVLDLSEDTLKIACFCCSTSLHSTADYVLILTFEQAQ